MRIALVTASFVAREQGYRLPGGWAGGDAATNEAFCPAAGFGPRFAALADDARALGFDALDLWSAHLNAVWAGPEHVEAARRAADARGLAILALGGALGDTADAFVRTCALARSVGARLLVGQTPVLETERETALEVLRRHGVRLAVENELLSPDEVLALIGDGAGGLLGAAPDTASFLEAGHDPVAAVRALAPLTLHVHLRNVVGPDDPAPAPFDAGAVDVEACLAAVAAARPDASIGIEAYSPAADPTDVLRRDRTLVAAWLARQPSRVPPGPTARAPRRVAARGGDRWGIGLVGVGDVAGRDYLPEFHRLEDEARLVAACGRSPERVRATAAAYGIDTVTTDYRDLVAHPEVDVVLNLTPFAIHAEVTLAALAAGRHVYSEKPLAMRLEDAERIRDAASERDLVVVAAPSILLFPQVRHAWGLVRAGVLGSIHTAHAHALGGVPPWAGYEGDPEPFFAEGVGPLADMGVYPLHALTGILGPARAVSARAARTRDSFVPPDGPRAGEAIPVRDPDSWVLLIELAGGALASVHTNMAVAASRAPELELMGEEGSVALSLLDVSQPVHVLRAGDDDWRTVHVPHDRVGGPDHILGVAHLLDCLRDGRVPVASCDHAIHVIELMAAARQSLRDGAVVPLATSFVPAHSSSVQGAPA